MVTKKEGWRKVLHLSLGVLLLAGGWWVLQQYGQQTLELALLVLLLVLIVCDVLVADYNIRLPIYAQLERPHEEACFHTATLAVLSGLLAFKLFVLPVAIVGISMFIFGDAAAALVGMRWGKRELGKKSFAGAAAMFAVSAVIGWLMLGWIGIVMAVVATLAECLVTRINDAVTIPLFAGVVGHALLAWS
jgi:dolichol kinase